MIGKQTKRKVTERDKERDQEREGIYLCIPHTATLPLQRTLEIESPAKQCSNPTYPTTLTRAQTYRNDNTYAATTWRAVHSDSKGQRVKFFLPVEVEAGGVFRGRTCPVPSTPKSPLTSWSQTTSRQ
jgi:hypothetical protein